MKTGRSLQDLAIEIERQNNTKKDFIASTRALEVEPAKSGIKLTMRNGSKGNGRYAFDINRTGHEQLQRYVEIPKDYYERIRVDSPELLAKNVNHWLEKKNEKRMIRTLDGNVRAILSDRYRPLDNHDVANNILPIIARHKDMRIESCEVTERRLYLKVVNHEIKAEIKKGDLVESGICIGNSEIGERSLFVERFAYILACLNGMKIPDGKTRRFHVGRRNEIEGESQEFYRDETRRADDRAFWMKMQDMVLGAFNQKLFEAVVTKLKAATKEHIEEDPDVVVETLQDWYKVTEDEGSSVLKYLAKGGDYTRYGLMNAVTRAAQDVESYDRSDELEAIGGQIIELPPSDWKTLAFKE